MAIINEDQLKSECIEGLYTLGIDRGRAQELLVDYVMAEIVTQMYSAQEFILSTMAEQEHRNAEV